MDFTFRPIDTWPGGLHQATSRRPSPFDTPYSKTLTLLRKELENLDAKHPVIQLALQEKDIRNDGLPRATCKPEHPGVILSFGSKHGDLKYATDVFHNAPGTTHSGWHANLRAIALGLEALRRVDRYGITKRGEQYTGWKELGSGAVPMGAGLNDERAITLLTQHTEGLQWDYDQPGQVRSAFRIASKTLHPDVGGDAETFMQVKAAAEYLIERYS